VAFSDTGSNIFSNPAGASRVTFPEVTFLYSKPYAGLPGIDLSEGFIAGVVPTPAVTVGAGLLYFDGEQIRETTGLLALSRQFTRTLGLGLAGRFLNLSYPNADANLDPVFAAGTSKSAVGLDVGGNYALGRMVRLGAVARNLNEPNVGLQTAEKLPRQIQLGIGLGSPLFRVAGDVVLQSKNTLLANEPTTPWALGGEYRIPDTPLALRAGINDQEYSGGFGLRLSSFRVDYSVLFSRFITNNSGSHQVALTYSFGVPAPRRVAPARRRAPVRRTVAPRRRSSSYPYRRAPAPRYRIVPQ
jgi:hypothetical protein